MILPVLQNRLPLFPGIGDTMIMLAALVSIQFYFERRRPLANGIALSGVGFGMMVLPPFYRFLLDRYACMHIS